MTRIGSIRRASAELNDDDGDVWFLDVDQTTAADSWPDAAALPLSDGSHNLAAEISERASATITYRPDTHELGTHNIAEPAVDESILASVDPSNANPILSIEESSGEIGNYKPSDNFGAPWHIDDFIHIQDIWPTYTGAGVRVGVYDNGVQYTHSDLNDNYDSSLHVVFSGFVQDPSDVVNSGPGGADKPHGTAVAGLIAAEANNVGVAGVAYNATLTGVLAYDFEYLGYSGQTALDYVQQAMAWAQNFDVSNHSYGSAVPFGDEAFISFGGGNQSWDIPLHYGNVSQSSLYTARQAGMETATEQGRNGLGSIFVVSAGNDRVASFTDRNGDGKIDRSMVNGISDIINESGDANANGGHTSSRYAIPVAALSPDTSVAFDSNPGANLLVSAPGVDLPTTDLMGADGYRPGDYALSFGGTSAAAPIVTGVVALMLEANPELGWRDVRTVLSLSAKHTGTAINLGHSANEFHDWFFNGATDWNGGGRHFSEDYGYGAIDAHAAVRLAETWTEQNTSANEFHVRPIGAGPTGDLPNGTGGVNSYTFAVNDQMTVETVTFGLALSHTRVADLHIWMTSPSGTTVDLLRAGTGWDIDINNGWNFTANAFMGESAYGVWTVSVQDVANNGDVGTITDAVFDLFGSPVTADNLYVYTNEFGTLPDDGQHEFVSLDANGGVDTINASAIASDTTIDFEQGHYVIAGREGFFGGGFGGVDPRLYMIENVVTGDGGDTIVGNVADNWLQGMRGVDNIYGGAGDDMLVATYENNFAFEIMDGGEDNDTANFASFNKAIWVDLTNIGREVWTRDTADLTSGTWREIADLNAVENVLGGNMDDSIWGNDGVNRIDGGGSSDTLYGRGDNDILIGGLGVDSVYGGDGDDTLIGTYEYIFGFDTFDGGVGIDTADFSRFEKAIRVNLTDDGREVWTRDAADLTSGTWRPIVDLIGLENVLGGSGDDDITGDGNANTLQGGAGDDTLTGRGGNDILDGGADTDTVAYAGAASNYVITAGNPGSNIFAIEDLTTGDVDFVHDVELVRFNGVTTALAATTSVTGTNGNDVLVGDAANNIMDGRGGDDVLTGGLGADSFDGGAGRDRMYVDAQDSSIQGGDGFDIVYADASTAATGLRFAHAGTGVEAAFGGAGNDVLDAAGAAIYDNMSFGGAGNDVLIASNAGNYTMQGGAGFDTAVFAGNQSDYTIAGGTPIGWPSWLRVTNNATGNISWLQTVERLQFADGTIDAPGLLPTALGTAGADVINAVAGGQVIHGLAGDDRLTGGSGEDVLDGGAGADRMSGGAGNDSFFIDNSDTLVDGGDGYDSVYVDDSQGGPGSVRFALAGTNVEFAYGGVGNDVFDASGVSSTVEFWGQWGDDVLTGGSGDDTLLGDEWLPGGGNDVLDGGAGNDWLDGGNGNDTFVVRLGSGVDTVGDFGQAGDQDVIRIAGGPFASFAALAASGAMVQSGANVVITLSAADQITLRNVQLGTLDASDFLFTNQVINGSSNAETLNGQGSDTIHGFGGNDVILGTGNTGVAFGDDGGDLLYFNGDQNQLSGGEGNDWLGVNGNNNALMGGAGDESWIGASGNGNTLAGGDGGDALFANGTGNYLHGETGNDWLGVSGSQNQLYGGAGSEWMGASGNGNLLFGGEGGDTLFSVGANVLYGETGDDWIGCSGNGNVLNGAQGNDYLAASGNNNTLDGGAGNDVLVAGGAHGGDRFVFHVGYGMDTVVSFSRHGAGGSDVVDLNGFGLNFSSLQGYMADVGGNCVITLDAATTLTIDGISKGHLLASDFLF